MKSFIETNFPVSKLSKECFKERKAGSGQTLTSLGKWWGRKPLILIRAIILGLLMPASNDPKKDLDIFLKILTMDDSGLKLRKNKSIDIEDIINHLSPSEKNKYIDFSSSKPKLKSDLSKAEKQQIQDLVFSKLSYDDKLKYCLRPEEVEITDENEWKIINDHLGTNANNLPDLINQLSLKRFNREITVGDCFSGGGSIPFEAARLGLKVYASDLNPIASLLTWAALNILGSSQDEIDKLKEFQQKVLNEVDKIITDLKIEHNELNHRANSYIYCHETKCPECNFLIPLAPNWIISVKNKTIAILTKNEQSLNYDIDIKSNVSNEELENAKNGTISDGFLKCPNCKNNTPITSIRKDYKTDDGKTIYGLRRWQKHEFIPRPDDVFQERLYCIRYEDENGNYYYTKPTDKDLEREKKVIEILSQKFNKWQEQGYIPDSVIEEGEETLRLQRERGYMYWHQLFNPRQLLINGLIMKTVSKLANTTNEKIIGLLGLNRCLNWSSKLTLIDMRTQSFYNQALNTLYNFGVRSFKFLSDTFIINLRNYNLNLNFICLPLDAREIKEKVDIWITDPPYADAINYHELSEFFLAWDKKMLKDIFKDWVIDSRRSLAVKKDNFFDDMVSIYKNLNLNMPDDGIQVIMFTHQDVKVWKDLTLILMAANLKVITAWTITTETDAIGLKEGNYVKGTVILVLKKQTSDNEAFLDEIYHKIENEVKNQIDIMLKLDNDSFTPNFYDPDYVLSAYVSALRILTSYKKIEDIDLNLEITNYNKNSKIEELINEAIRIAYEYLVPKDFNKNIWRQLNNYERFYIKCLDIEKKGVNQLSTYQEIARGFGVKEYNDLLFNKKANNARLKTALEFSTKLIGNSTNPFSNTLLRHVLLALYHTIKKDNTETGRNYLKEEIKDYWVKRNIIIELLNYISNLKNYDKMKHWENEINYAALLSEYIKNDGI